MLNLSQIKPKYELGTTNARITSKSGLALVYEQACALGLPELIDRYLPVPGSNRGYSPAAFVLPILMTLTGGGRSIEDIREIRLDSGLRELCGLSKMPASDAIGKWIRKKDVLKGLKMINRAVRKRIIKKLENRQFTVDNDATYIESDKKSAEMTYKGFRGYSPMYTFLAENGLCVASDFRTGNTSPRTGIFNHLLESEKLLKGCGKSIACFRSDSAAYTGNIFDYCEDNGITYYVAADMDISVRRAIRRIPEHDWIDCGKGLFYGETYHAMNKAKHGFTLAVKREELRREGCNLELFRDLPEKFYHAVATNDQSFDTRLIHDMYNGRSNAENFIKETKYGFGLNYCPSQDFTGNAVWFEIGILAYNLVIAMKQFVLEGDLKYAMVATLRWRLFSVAGKVVKHGRRLILKLNDWYRELFRKARDALQKCCVSSA